MVQAKFDTLKYFAIAAVASLFSLNAFAASGVTYQGRILKPDGSPLAGANVQFKLQIRTPDAGNCLMYEEVQALDMRNSNGVFALTINDGTGSRTDSTGFNLDRVFSDAQGTANSFTFDPTTCSSGSSYIPNASDGRNLVVLFKDETMATYEPMPAQKINFVPLAFEAKQIAGFKPQSLVRVAEADGTLGNISPLSNANYTELLALIGGTSSQYAKQSAAAGTIVSTVGGTGNVATPSAGSVWLDTTAGNLKFYDGSSIKTLGTAGGSVTSVATGTGLTGGPITTTGTISLATLGTGGTGFKVTYDTYGRVTGAVALVEADIPTLTTAGHVSGSAITSGTIAGSTAISTTGTISSGAITSSGLITSPSLSSTAIGTQSVQIFETTNSFKVSIVAPASLSANYALTLPTTAGGANQVLTTNGSGVLSWTTPAGTGISALTGDVTASGSGSVAATVAAVGGVTAANVASGANLANAATNLNTASTIVKRDASGNFAASAVTEASTVYKDTGANTVTVSAPTSVTSSYVMKWPAAVAASAGQVLSSDTSGNLSWSSLPTSMAPSGSAGGDLSGSYPNPSVATVGTSSAANVHSAELAANAATAVNTASKIVARDASGNFAANVATVNGVALNNAGSILNITNPVGGAWNMTLPATSGSNGQVMRTNGSGVMSWVTPLTSATGFLNGGNSFGANASIGTNDAFRLDVKTNNAVAMTVDTAGKVGIGTTLPTAALDVAGSLLAEGTTGATPASGAGTRFEWVAAKGALRAGVVTGAQWDDANIGTNSVVIGQDSTATANYSSAFGYQNVASGVASSVLGSSNTASGSYSSAIGAANWATNWGSTAIGVYGGANGARSIALSSQYAIADASSETAMGQRTLSLGGEDGWNWVSTDPLLLLGNGNATPSNALVVLKNAKTIINSGTLTNATTPSISTVMAGAMLTSVGATADSTAAGLNVTDSAGASKFFVRNDGNVGISTTAPAVKLDVVGTLKIGDGGETCGASYAGAVRYNGGAIQFCNGTSWGALGGGAAPSVAASAGTAGAPSISFSGDSDTGLYSNGANVIGVSAGGSNVFNISSSGLVSPTTGGASVTTSNGTAAAPTYSFAGDTGTGWWRPAASTMAASTGGSERMRIDSSGYVGIGTTAPFGELANTATNTLDQVGTGTGGNSFTWANNLTSYVASITNTSGGVTSNTLLLKTGSTANTARILTLNANGTDTFVATGAGNVGIGTTAPGGRLDVGSTGWALFNNNVQGALPANLINDRGIALGWNMSGGAAEANLVYGTSLGSSYFNIGSYNGTVYNERMRFDAAGNVGIGTTSPSATFSVGDGVASDGTIVAKGWGTVGTDGAALTASGAGTRMVWYPKKAAFRAGYVGDNSWDDANIGNYSAVFGGINKASGGASFSAGWSNVATGGTSIAMGNSNWAVGTGSVAIGSALNNGGYSETVFGQWNKWIGTENSSSWVSTDPLFVVGNGTGAGATSNALMMFKNGQTLINGGATVAVPAGSASLTSMGTTTTSAAASFNATDSAGSSKFYVRNDGKVGIGTIAPSEKLDVSGAVRLATTASMNAGTLRWNGTNFQGTDGVSWFNIMPNPPAAGGCDQTQTFNSAGTYGYTVPSSYATITIKVWGGGGAGGDYFEGQQPSGSASTISSLGLTAGGGSGGSNRNNNAAGTYYGIGGTSSGGSINTAGSNGAHGTQSTISGAGGSAPNGGSGGAGMGNVAGANSGATPGGGGGAGGWNGLDTPAGGGSGGYTEKTFTPGMLPPGTTINDIVVGAGAIGSKSWHSWGGGYGGTGQVSVICSTTGTPASLGWGSCSIAAFSAGSGSNSQTCTGVVAGSPISCSPASAPSAATTTWSARASGADTVDINLSAAFGVSTTWKCMFMNP